MLTPNLRKSMSPTLTAKSSAKCDPEALCHSVAPITMWACPQMSHGVSAFGASRVNCEAERQSRSYLEAKNGGGANRLGQAWGFHLELRRPRPDIPVW